MKAIVFLALIFSGSWALAQNHKLPCFAEAEAGVRSAYQAQGLNFADYSDQMSYQGQPVVMFAFDVHANGEKLFVRAYLLKESCQWLGSDYSAGKEDSGDDDVSEPFE